MGTESGRGSDFGSLLLTETKLPTFWHFGLSMEQLSLMGNIELGAYPAGGNRLIHWSTKDFGVLSDE